MWQLKAITVLAAIELCRSTHLSEVRKRNNTVRSSRLCFGMFLLSYVSENIQFFENIK